MYPEKKGVVEIAGGKGSSVIPGRTVRKKRSIQQMPRMHFVQRWQSPKAMKRKRDRVHAGWKS